MDDLLSHQMLSLQVVWSVANQGKIPESCHITYETDIGLQKRLQTKDNVVWSV